MFNHFMADAHYQKYEEKRLEYLFSTRFAGKSVLDVGCGKGKYLEMCRKHGCPAAGVDINPDQVAELQTRGFEAYTPDALPDSLYDVIVMSHVIEHQDSADMIAFMEHYLSLLKDDGRLIVITPVLGSRFYYDFTHARPYYPQSLWMLFGDLVAPASYKSGWKMELDDIYFFRDPVRLRWGWRSYYPCVAQHMGEVEFKIYSIGGGLLNIFFTALFKASCGKIGVPASWLGIYRRKA